MVMDHKLISHVWGVVFYGDKLLKDRVCCNVDGS